MWTDGVQMKRVVVLGMFLAGVAMLVGSCTYQGPLAFASKQGYTACAIAGVETVDVATEAGQAITAVKSGSCNGGTVSAALASRADLWVNGPVVRKCGTGTLVSDPSSTRVDAYVFNQWCTSAGGYFSTTYHEGWITGTKYTTSYNSGVEYI